MSGDAAFYSTRSRLLSVATDPSLSASERVVALGLGLHLVQDRLSHIGLTGLLQHFFRFGFSDAKAKSPLGDLAQDATAKFLADFKDQLVKKLGEKGAEETIAGLEKAASGLSTGGVFNNVRDIEGSLVAGEEPGHPQAGPRS